MYSQIEGLLLYRTIIVLGNSHRHTHVKTAAWFCLLTGLNMVELASLNSVVDRIVHAC